MTVKKEYRVGDTVWVYGIGASQKPTKGRVVHACDIDGYSFTQYVIAISTEIEDLLEIRTWHNISEDEHGPVGSFREMSIDLNSTKKLLSKAGLTLDIGPADDDLSDDEPTQEEIHAAIEKSRKDVTHSPLVLKDNKPRRRNYPRKKKL